MYKHYIFLNQLVGLFIPFVCDYPRQVKRALAVFGMPLQFQLSLVRACCWNHWKLARILGRPPLTISRWMEKRELFLILLFICMLIHFDLLHCMPHKINWNIWKAIKLKHQLWNVECLYLLAFLISIFLFTALTYFLQLALQCLCT